MSKSKKTKSTESAVPLAKAVIKLGAEDDSVDPTLASLFASSSGPVKVPAKHTQSAKKASVPVQVTQEDETSSSEADSFGGSDNDSNNDNTGEDDRESSDDSSEETTPANPTRPGVTAERPRKRKRGADKDDLEQAYFKRLQREEDKENKQAHPEEEHNDEDTSSEGDDDSVSEPSEIEVLPRHEVFDKKLSDKDKSNRTVFLGNISTEAIRVNSAKRTLTRHLRSVLKTPADGKRPGKLESIRFRSTAYTAKSGPKRATFAKKELMDTTTTSTNAYAVFTTELAAQHVANKLNGTVVLDRHLRVDYLAKPLPVEHKRCVFIGNLSFVNEETPQPSDESQQRRPTAKQPADAEEGLWRTFSKCGAVESVRVVRDQETRVSKGFAYVQFKDENSVEAALLMNEKKFPPMLPRKLRVMRARKTKVKPATFPIRRAPKAGAKGVAKPSKSSLARGRAGKPIIFEGHRASEGTTRKGKPQSLNDRTKERNKKRPHSKSAQRGANFKRVQTRKRS